MEKDIYNTQFHLGQSFFIEHLSENGNLGGGSHE